MHKRHCFTYIILATIVSLGMSAGPAISQSSGTVGPGTVGQIAVYTSSGMTVSGASTLPAGVQSNITQLGALTSSLTGTSAAFSSSVTAIPPAYTDNSNTLISSSWLHGAWPGFSSNVESTSIPGIDNGNLFFFNAPSSSSSGNPTATLRVDRHPSYSGGSGIYNAIWTYCQTSAGETSFEWCQLSQLENFTTSTSTNQVGLYTTGRRHPNAGSTWALVSEIDDYNANPTGGSISAEFDVWATGGDSNNSRVGIDIVGGVGAVIPSPTTPTIGFGLRIGAFNGAASNANFTNGLYYNPANFDALIRSSSGTSFNHAMDLTASSCNSDIIKATYFIVNCNGSVGIGNNSPALALDVHGSSSSAQIRVLGGADMRLDATVGALGSYSNNDAILVANNAERLRAYSGGGVKITGDTEVTGLFTIDTQLNLNYGGGLTCTETGSVAVTIGGGSHRINYC